MEFDDPLLLATSGENRRRCGGRTAKGGRCKRMAPEWYVGTEAWFCHVHRR